MRLLQTSEGSAKSLRFGPVGLGLFVLSEAGPGSRRGYDLYERAIRVDPLSGSIIQVRAFSGSEVACFSPDFRDVYYSVSVAVAGGELDLRRMNLARGKEELVYEANVP